MTEVSVWVLAVLRWLLFAGLSGALGGLAGRGLSRQYKGNAPGPLPSPWALRSSLVGLVAAVGLALVTAGGGSLAAGLAHPLAHRLSSSTAGVIAITEAAAFAAAAALLRVRLAGLSVLPLLAVVAAEGVRAHPEGIVPVGGALLTYAHLLPAAMWAGMLLYVLRAAIAWRSDPSAMRSLVRLYGNAAAWLFALVVATGVVSALVLVPLGSLLTTSYGIVVIVKAAIVVVVAALAIAGRLWLRHLPPAGAGPALVTKLECGLLAAALAVTGLLTALTPPAPPASPATARAAPASPATAPTAVSQASTRTWRARPSERSSPSTSASEAASRSSVMLPEVSQTTATSGTSRRSAGRTTSPATDARLDAGWWRPATAGMFRRARHLWSSARR